MIPDSWKETNIVQIFKGNASRNDISGFRNIHSKIETSKVFGEIVTKEMKNIITEGLSKFQIGAIPRHQPQEHILAFKSNIAIFNSSGKEIKLNLYDIVK